MFVIIVYDVSVDRVTKVLHFLRRYLNWIQNSVFEGEVTEKQLVEIEHGLSQRIKKSTDMVRLYILRSEDAVKIKTLGTEKSDTSTII